MPTLNDAPFKIIRQVFTTVQNNSIKDILGSDTVSVEHMGYSTEPLRLVCFVQNEDEYDNFKEEYHSSGTQTLIIHENSGRQYTVYGLGSTTEIDGEVENYKQGIVFMATFKQATPYKESTEEITLIKTIITQNQEWSDGNLYLNLLENGEFEEWSAGASAAPDNYSVTGAGATIARESTTIHNGTYSAKFTGDGSVCFLYQNMPFYVNYQGKTVTFGAWVYASVANRGKLGINDGVTTTFSSYHSGGSTWEFLTVTKTFDNAATVAQVRCCAYNGTDDVYFDDAVFVEGSFIPTSGRSITTNGNVDAVPDIQVTGVGSEQEMNTNPVGEPSFETITGWTYSELDTGGGSVAGSRSAAQKYHGSYSYQLLFQPTVNLGDYGQITRDVDFSKVEKLTFRWYHIPNGSKIFCKIGGVEVWSTTAWEPQFELAEIDVSSYMGVQSLVFRLEAMQTISVTCNSFIDNILCYNKANNIDIEVYNTDDTTTKSAVSNVLLDGAVYRVNADGTGKIDFDDDFITDDYVHTHEGQLNTTYDGVNDKLDIADDGYIYWKKDTKYPITGTPTLTARINITAGTPTIQISTDASTWYDIDTAIVDDVETVYPLDSDGNLSLAGKTVFYWRIDCVKAAAATSSVKYFKLDIAIHTIYAKNPKITKGASASTFRCDQDPNSGLECIVALIFRHRWWT